MSIGTTTLWLDSKELVKRKLKVLKENTSSTLYKNEKPELVKPTHCMIVQDSGAVLNNNIVAIVNPETGQLCDPDEYGEIWVCSPANIDSYSNSLQKDNESNFNLSIEGVDSNVRFTRTGDYGFLWPVRESDHDEDDDNNSEKGSLHNSNNRLSPNNNACGWDQLVFAGLNYQMVLFVLGSVNETIEVNGMLHYPSDIEDTIDASHINIVSDSW